MTLCQTPNNPYNGALYQESRLLADQVLEGLTRATGCRREYVWETDTMAGINWSRVPVTLIEVGYLTNQEEEALLVTEEYREKIAAGITEGVLAYLELRENG